MNWKAIQNEYGTFVVTQNGNCVASIVGDFNKEDRLKHAKLIAAAPELLKSLTDRVVHNYEELENFKECIAAIEKAIGENPL